MTARAAPFCCLVLPVLNFTHRCPPSSIGAVRHESLELPFLPASLSLSAHLPSTLSVRCAAASPHSCRTARIRLHELRRTSKRFSQFAAWQSASKGRRPPHDGRKDFSRPEEQSAPSGTAATGQEPTATRTWGLPPCVGAPGRQSVDGRVSLMKGPHSTSACRQLPECSLDQGTLAVTLAATLAAPYDHGQSHRQRCQIHEKRLACFFGK